MKAIADFLQKVLPETAFSPLLKLTRRRKGRNNRRRRRRRFCHRSISKSGRRRNLSPYPPLPRYKRRLSRGSLSEKSVTTMMMVMMIL